MSLVTLTRAVVVTLEGFRRMLLYIVSKECTDQSPMVLSILYWSAGFRAIFSWMGFGATEISFSTLLWKLQSRDT